MIPQTSFSALEPFAEQCQENSQDEPTHNYKEIKMKIIF